MFLDHNRSHLITIDQSGNESGESSKRSLSHEQFKSGNKRDESSKPQFSYAQLIVQAIQSSPEKPLTSSAICLYISQNYPFYKMWYKSWQNEINFTLHQNPNFVRVLGSENGKSKLSKTLWKIHSTDGIPSNTIPNCSKSFSSKSKLEGKF